MRLCEEFKIVPVLQPEDHQAAAATCESICVKNLRHVTYLVHFGDLTGNSILYVYEGATDAACTSAMTFSYRLASAIIEVANADVLGTESTSAALTLTAATYEDKLLVIEVDLDTMTDGYDWLTLYIDNTSTEMFASAVAVCHPKYGSLADVTVC